MALRARLCKRVTTATNHRAPQGSYAGVSLAHWWLRLCAPKAGSTGSIPGRGTKTGTRSPRRVHVRKQEETCFPILSTTVEYKGPVALSLETRDRFVWQLLPRWHGSVCSAELEVIERRSQGQTEATLHSPRRPLG